MTAISLTVNSDAIEAKDNKKGGEQAHCQSREEEARKHEGLHDSRQLERKKKAKVHVA